MTQISVCSQSHVELSSWGFSTKARGLSLHRPSRSLRTPGSAPQGCPLWFAHTLDGGRARVSAQPDSPDTLPWGPSVSTLPLPRAAQAPDTCHLGPDVKEAVGRGQAGTQTQLRRAPRSSETGSVERPDASGRQLPNRPPLPAAPPANRLRFSGHRFAGRGYPGGTRTQSPVVSGQPSSVQPSQKSRRQGLCLVAQPGGVSGTGPGPHCRRRGREEKERTAARSVGRIPK